MLVRPARDPFHRGGRELDENLRAPATWIDASAFQIGGEQYPDSLSAAGPQPGLGRGDLGICAPLARQHLPGERMGLYIAQEGVDCLAHSFGPRALGKDALRDMVEQLCAFALEQPEVQLLLRAKVVVEDCARNARGLCDLADTGRFVASRRKRLERRLGDSGPPGRGPQAGG